MTKQLIYLLAFSVTASDGSTYTGDDPHHVTATGVDGSKR